MIDIDLDDVVPPDQQDDLESQPVPHRRRARLDRERVTELVSVVMLSVASVLAAWSGYQATEWNGDQAELYSRAAAARIESIRQSNIAHQFAIIDLELFNLYVVATIEENDTLAQFQVRRFRDDFRVAFDAWLALDSINDRDATASPLTMPEYQPKELLLSAELDEQSEELFAAGSDAGATGGEYVLATVFLAIVLFFVGISSRLNWWPARVSLIAAGGGILVFVIWQLAGLPVA